MDKFNLPSVSGDQNMKNSKQDDLNKAHALINSNVIRNLTNSSIYPDDESKMDDHFKLDDMKNLSLPPPPTPMSNATSLPPPPTPQHNQSVHSFTQDISSQNINSIIVSEPDIMYPTPVIQNIVTTFNIGCSVNLKMIACHARNAEYNPKKFSALIMRIREPRTTALIFNSGRIVCTGAKSVELSKLASRKYARIIQKLGFEAKFKEFKVQNIVASGNVMCPIRLEGLCYAHSQFCSYEPELFPGLVYRMLKPRIVILIFVSGKLVLTGGKFVDEIYEAFDIIAPICKAFQNKATTNRK